MHEFIKKHALDDFNTRSFEEAVSCFAENGLSEEIIADLVHFLKEDTHNTLERFIAFFVLFTFYRRSSSILKANKLVADYEQTFESILLMQHVLLLHKATYAQTPEQLKSLMDNSRHLILTSNLKSHIGLIHLYCHTTATYLEIMNYDLAMLENHPALCDYLHTAESWIHTCIQENPNYAKFYATSGRISLLLGHYDQAVNAFIMAKQKEKITRVDYTNVINGYQDYLLYAKQLKQSNQIALQQKKLEESVKDIHANNIKLISMFTGLLSLVIGNITVISSQANPIKTMFIFNSMFVLFFGLILVVTNLISPSKHRIVLWIIASLLTAFGLIFLLAFYANEFL